MIKILHTGDFHLDSPFTGVDLPTGERLRDELRKIFIDVVELAGAHDMMLIAGDLFDEDTVSKRLIEATLATVDSASEIMFLYLQRLSKKQTNNYP